MFTFVSETPSSPLTEGPQVPAQAKETCAHCDLPIKPGQAHTLEEQGTAHQFCCPGCVSVWQMIHGSGLGSYYAKRDIVGTESPIEFENNLDFTRFDRESIATTYIQSRTEELVEIHLLLEGVHCAACVWLVEKFLTKQPGIHEARLNITTHRANVVWNPSQIKLSEIIAKLYSIGYPAQPYDPAIQENQRRNSLRDMIRRLAVAGFCAGNTMMLSLALYAGYFNGIETEFKLFFEGVSAALSLPALLYSAVPFWRGAKRALQMRSPNMDLLISLGIGITFSYSVIALFTQHGAPYFDSCVMIIFFLLIGRTLEHFTRTKVISITERLSNLTPQFVTRLTNDHQETVALEEVEPGDRLLVRAGDTIPVDGVIESGESEIDESSLTGESKWRFVKKTDSLFGGTINQTNAFVMKAQAIGQNTVLSRIVQLVENAAQHKPKIQRLADFIASWFVWVVLFLGSVTWGFWFWKDATLWSASPWLASVSVIIIACPCALGLATPTAILAGTRIATKLGVLFKGGDVLEQATEVTDIVFDKTGTLTEGKMTVVDIQHFTDQPIEAWLPMILALENLSQHPIAKSLQQYADTIDCEIPTITLEACEVLPGLGLKGKYANQWILVGNRKLMTDFGIVLPNKESLPLSSVEPHLEVYVAVNQMLLAKILLKDALKPEALQTTQALQSKGVRLHILSGDRPEIVANLAQHLNIDSAHGGLLPDEKLMILKGLQDSGKQVLMVGDGVNDAPALNQAHLGVAMNNATDISVDAADVVLMNTNLQGVLQILQISQKTRRLIKQNLGISLAYNAVTIPMAMMGLITPLIAALAMAFSSLFVTVNSLRFRETQS